MAVNFGFIREKLEIKILILFIMRRLAEPVSPELLASLTLCEDGISFFDFAECLAELVGSGHLNLDGGAYALTEKGARNGEITEKSLPASVGIKVEEATSKALAARRRDANIGTLRTQRPDGRYDVRFSMSDGVGDIMALELYAANRRQAKELERGFRKNAEKVHNAILETIFEEEE